jgi:hypothetical protein
MRVCMWHRCLSFVDCNNYLTCCSKTSENRPSAVTKSKHSQATGHAASLSLYDPPRTRRSLGSLEAISTAVRPFRVPPHTQLDPSAGKSCQRRRNKLMPIDVATYTRITQPTRGDVERKRARGISPSCVAVAHASHVIYAEWRRQKMRSQPSISVDGAFEANFPFRTRSADVP